jgi:hypothetical protein
MMVQVLELAVLPKCLQSLSVELTRLTRMQIMVGSLLAKWQRVLGEAVVAEP